MNADDRVGRYAHSLLLFALGVVLLGHGAAATALAGDVPLLLTVGLPFAGVALAHRSLVRHLPADSALSSNGFLLVLAGATTGFVNVAIPPFYGFVGVFDGTTPTLASGYWSAFVVSVAAAALLSFELSNRAVPVGVDTVLPPVAGAALMTALFDYARLEAADRSGAQ